MLMWLAIWNSRLFCPAKYTGTTGALADEIRRAAKFFHSASTARLLHGLGAVDAPPAGNTTRTPPRNRWALAAARDLRLVSSASFVSAKSIGSRWARISSAW